MEPSVRPALRAFAFTALLVLLPALGLTACEGDYRPEAVGEEGAITVVVDSTRWTGELGEAIRATLAPNVQTLPAPEAYFKLKQVDLDSEQTYSAIQDRKNIVFIAPLSDSTNEANFLRRRFSEEARQAVMNGQSAVVERPNLWRRSQRVYFVTARDTESLIAALENGSREMRSAFKSITLERMEEEMFERARQQTLEDSLMQTHGFAVNVQHDYAIALQERTDSTGFVYLRRVLTDTWRNLLVYYVENADPSRITPEWIYNTRDSLTRQYVRGNVSGFMRIDYRRPLETMEEDFLGRYGYETRGLWHMVADPDSVDGVSSSTGYVELGMGGAFLTYAFYDQPTDRVYLLDGAVFAPGFDKLRFIRQMEVIARTFRTEQEAGSEETEAVADAGGSPE